MTDEINGFGDTAPIASEGVPPTEQPPAPPAPASMGAPAHERVSFPKRWLVIGGTVAVAVVLLAGTFAAGVAVGSRAGGGFGRRGNAAFSGMLPNADNAQGRMPGGRGWDDSSGFDGGPGRGMGRDWQGAPQNRSTTPTQ